SFIFLSVVYHLYLHSFPTRRSSDLWNDVMIFNEYKEMTNMNINWKLIPDEGLEEKRNLALSGGTLPDAFHNASIPVKDIFKYGRSEEHTSELQSRFDLVCRLLLEKK